MKIFFLNLIKKFCVLFFLLLYRPTILKKLFFFNHDLNITLIIFIILRSSIKRRWFVTKNNLFFVKFTVKYKLIFLFK